MRKAVLIPLALGFILLIVGIVKSYSSLGNTRGIVISSSGTIASNGESNYEPVQPQQASSTSQLDIIGFLTIIASLGFFTLAYMNNRNPYSKNKTTVT